VGDTSGGRPFARFSAVDCNNQLIHCSYSHDESLHTFSTLDSMGVVRLYDDRRYSNLDSTDCCVSSFVAHTRNGVGIAAIPPLHSTNTSESTPSRWITWGLDASDDRAANNNLVVKIWDSSPKQPQKNRAATVSTVSTDELDESETENMASESFHVTSCTYMQGAAAARVHPLAPGTSLFVVNALIAYSFQPISHFSVSRKMHSSYSGLDLTH
jgi:hypothetical protein